MQGHSWQECWQEAEQLFRKVAEYAASQGTCVVLEANPACYQCEFLNRAKDAQAIVRALNHPGFGLHLDTACMQMGGDDIAATMRYNVDVTQHVHLSMPWLGRFPDMSAQPPAKRPRVSMSACAEDDPDKQWKRMEVPHDAFAEAVADSGYAHVLSIEMRHNEADSVKCLTEAVQYVKETYGEALAVPAKK